MTLPERFRGMTTVEPLADDDIVLVGENHKNGPINDLTEDLLDELEPNTVAIENQRPVAHSSGMGVATRYASRNDVAVAAIDESLWREVETETSVLADANEFTYPIQSDGSLDARSIYNARARIKAKYGEEMFRKMYVEREIDMARRLRHLYDSDEFATPITVHIGVFHITALRDMWYAQEGNPMAVSAERVRV